jgi:hypothetical protein
MVQKDRRISIQQRLRGGVHVPGRPGTAQRRNIGVPFSAADSLRIH